MEFMRRQEHTTFGGGLETGQGTRAMRRETGARYILPMRHPTFRLSREQRFI
ncbi:MAG TPA: hypothetical protein VEX60_08105 [Pyrinomonadaceae bacterium]|nr:hypothetical protein [Pyrinomonadaceae bacterium]